MRKVLLFLLIVLPGVSVVAQEDSLVLERIYSFPRNYTHDVSGFQSNVYIKHLYQTHQRNFTLWAVPSMYAIARGQRAFVSEQYSRLTFKEDGNYDNLRQVYYTTIPHNRRTMPTLLEFITPNLYDVTLYSDHILSPFHRDNHVFYKYTAVRTGLHTATLYFWPRYVRNTQLVRGKATIDYDTGRIINAEFNGEFDMLHFQTLTTQGEHGSRALLPTSCRTKVEFRFLGNKISSAFEAHFDCPVTLPDSVNVKGDRALIDSIRPISLTDEELAIYQHRDSLRAQNHTTDTVLVDTLQHSPRQRKHNYLKEIGWDLVGENLIRSLRTSSEAGYVKLSPILNPQYLTYSHSKGFSYRFKLGARYNFNDDLSLGVNTRFGYNFKQKKFYFNLPIRLEYNYRNRDAYAEIVWANGNRISNSSIIDELKRQMGDLPMLDEMGLDKFEDQNLRVTNYLPLNNRLAIEAGLVFHERLAVDKRQMKEMGMPTAYRSLAPMVSVKTRPWHKGPLFTIDYERGLPGKNIDLAYERWEIDASLKHAMKRLQTLNLRLGTGFYTKRDKQFFMDYANFRDENLPGGWDDDWTGNFQLLRSSLYNASNYYVRGNVSFESPLLAASFIPWVGKYVERERIYLSSLSIANSRLYSELGYGFTCRYFSVGAFASFKNLSFERFGTKFTFELFRRW